MIFSLGGIFLLSSCGSPLSTLYIGLDFIDKHDKSTLPYEYFDNNYRVRIVSIVGTCIFPDVHWRIAHRRRGWVGRGAGRGVGRYDSRVVLTGFGAVAPRVWRAPVILILETVILFSDASPRHDCASLLSNDWRGQTRREMRPKAENRADIAPVEIHVGILIDLFSFWF